MDTATEVPQSSFSHLGFVLGS